MSFCGISFSIEPPTWLGFTYTHITFLLFLRKKFAAGVDNTWRCPGACWVVPLTLILTLDAHTRQSFPAQTPVCCGCYLFEGKKKALKSSLAEQGLGSTNRISKKWLLSKLKDFLKKCIRGSCLSVLATQECKDRQVEGGLMTLVLCSAMYRTLHTQNRVTGEACFARSKEALPFVLSLAGYMFEPGRIFNDSKTKRKEG